MGWRQAMRERTKAREQKRNEARGLAIIKTLHKDGVYMNSILAVDCEHLRFDNARIEGGGMITAINSNVTLNGCTVKGYNENKARPPRK